MGKRVVDDTSLTALADAFREKTGSSEALTFPADFVTGVDEVFEAGEKSEYDRFWESYLRPDEDGMVDGSYMFAGNGWKTEILKTGSTTHLPTRKYKSTMCMFRNNKAVKDMWFWTLSTRSYNTNSNYMFDGCSNLKRYLNFRYSPLETSAYCTFRNCSSLYAFNSFWFDENIKTYSEVFKGCTSLRTLPAYKKIDGTGLDFSDCPLTVDSLVSIIGCLVKQTSGTKTITFGTTNLSKLTAAQKAVATGKGWTLA